MNYMQISDTKPIMKQSQNNKNTKEVNKLMGHLIINLIRVMKTMVTQTITMRYTPLGKILTCEITSKVMRMLISMATPQLIITRIKLEATLPKLRKLLTPLHTNILVITRALALNMLLQHTPMSHSKNIDNTIMVNSHQATE